MPTTNPIQIYPAVPNTNIAPTDNTIYRIIYDLNGGKNNPRNPSIYTASTTVKLASPTKKGYLFKGWYTDNNFNAESKIVTISKETKSTVTLYAKWEKVKKPAKAVLKSAKSRKSGTITVTAKKVSSVTGYQFVVATDKKFKKNVKTVNTKKLTTTCISLKKGTTYYIKVRAYKTDSAGKKVYGAYSSVKRIKVKK